ncbi:hypothetical protein R6Q59_015792 [Mikania micrantha]
MNDKDVAVKKLDRNGYQGNQEFLVEALLLSLLDHSNLVNLLGYCCEGDQRILVYKYMPNGSLEDHLFRRYPTTGLYQALALAAMCLQEDATKRPAISNVIEALEYLAS